MSVVTVQIGQCGNQIGEKLFSTLAADCNASQTTSRVSSSSSSTTTTTTAATTMAQHELDYVGESRRRFFTGGEDDGVYQDDAATSVRRTNATGDGHLYARALLVDMESKVVNKLAQKRYVCAAAAATTFSTTLSAGKIGTWSFRAESAYTQKQGSGNNWSYGYFVNGRHARHSLEELIRREAERCDRLAAFHVIMSMAGGTGSGVGSYLTELARGMFPRATIVNTCVWPFATGEVTLQNYNFLLTLAKLYESADAIVLLENDILHRICKQMRLGVASGGSGRKEITFDDLNAICGHKLASVLQPAWSLEPHAGGAGSSCCNSYNLPNYLNELLSGVCCDSRFKLLSLHNLPQVSEQAIAFCAHKWDGLYRNARQLLYTGGFMDEGLDWSKASNAAAAAGAGCNRSLGLAVFARGPGASGAEHSALVRAQFGESSFVARHFAHASLYGLGLSPAIAAPVQLWQTGRSFNQYEKCLSLLSNSQQPAHKMDTLVGKAWQMYRARAYLHQYEKFPGFDQQLLHEAFIGAEQIIKDYKTL